MADKIQWFVLILYDYEGYGFETFDTENEALEYYDAKRVGGTAEAIIKGTVIKGSVE